MVAEAGERRSPYAIADASGDYTLFNVPSAGVQIRGYRKGLQVEPTAIAGGNGEHLEAVDLAVSTRSRRLPAIRFIRCTAAR